MRTVRNGFLARGFATVLALVVCGGALDWGHAGGDDADCGIGLTLHDHDAHRFNGVPANPAPPANHCYICHSLQLLHSALKPHDGRVVLHLQSARYSQPDHLLARSAPGLALSSRAPPSVSV
jgi:hypothetical protein